jgi:hypothetical protein
LRFLTIGRTPGNLGAWCLHRTEGDVTHFEMLTFWDNTDAIRRFAGDDYSLAKYYDFDRDYLIEMEPRVRHYDVLDSHAPGHLAGECGAPEESLVVGPRTG